MEVAKTGTIDASNIKEEVIVPEIRGLSIKEARNGLKDLDLGLRIEGMSDEEFKKLDYANTIIKEQSPKPGIKIESGSSITIEID